jgi:hypothetical protein
MNKATSEFVQIDSHVAAVGLDADISAYLIKKYQATYLGIPFNMYIVPNVTVDELKNDIESQTLEIPKSKTEYPNALKFKTIEKKQIQKPKAMSTINETGYYDYDNKPLKVGDLIRFNPAQSYYRDSTQYGQIKNISNTGSLYFYHVPVIRQNLYDDSISSQVKIKPDITGNITQGRVDSMSLKRGRNKHNGYYRYQGYDIFIKLVSPDDEYIIDTYY